MKPMDWLRRQAKPMTPEQKTIFLQVCEAVDTNIRDARLALAQPAPPRETFTMPSFTVEIEAKLTETGAEQIRRQFEAALRPRIPASARVPSADSTCDCWPHYIDCCCDVRKHAQQQ